MSIFKRFMEKPVSGRSREKFENADKPTRKKSDDEIDWIHYNVIHHIDHALPGATTAQGSYYEVTARDFEGVVEECKKLLPQISISTEDVHIFDDKILTSFDVVSIVAELSETYDVELGAVDIVPENFNSARALFALVQRIEAE